MLKINDTVKLINLDREEDGDVKLAMLPYLDTVGTVTDVDDGIIEVTFYDGMYFYFLPSELQKGTVKWVADED